MFNCAERTFTVFFPSRLIPMRYVFGIDVLLFSYMWMLLLIVCLRFCSFPTTMKLSSIQWILGQWGGNLMPDRTPTWNNWRFVTDYLFEMFQCVLLSHLFWLMQLQTLFKCKIFLVNCYFGVPVLCWLLKSLVLVVILSLQGFFFLLKQYVNLRVLKILHLQIL